MPTGDFGTAAELPVDPWVLGALLGDGNLTETTIRFSTAVEAMRQRLTERIDATLELAHAGGVDWRIVQRHRGHRKGVCGMTANPLTLAIKALGLWGLRQPREVHSAARISTRRESSGSICCAACSTRMAGSSAGERFAIRRAAASSPKVSSSSPARWAPGAGSVRSATRTFATRGNDAKAESAWCARSTISDPKSLLLLSEKAGASAAQAVAQQAPHVRSGRADARLPDAMHCGNAPIPPVPYRRLCRHAQHGAGAQHRRARCAQHRHARRRVLDGNGRVAARDAADRLASAGSISTSCAPAGSRPRIGTSCRRRSAGSMKRRS